MQITGYDGFTFNDLLGSGGDIDLDTEYGWQVNMTVVQRAGDSPLLASGNPTPRTIDVTFTYTGARTDFWQLFDELIGRLRPEDQSSKRKLYATRPDGTAVWRYARISVPSNAPEVNFVVVRFVSEDPRWYETATTSVTPWDATWTHPGAIYPGVNRPAIAVPNGGTAAVHPTITIKAGGYSAGTGGWTYRRKQTLTNNLTRTISNTVILVELGDTAALVSGGKALSSGNDFRVVGPDGLEAPRNLVNWNTALSWVYIYVAQLEPGEAQDYYFVYGNSAAGTPDTLTYPYLPAYRIDWTSATSSSSVDAGKTWINIGTGASGVSFSGQWTDCALYFVNGANAGAGKRIISSEASTDTNPGRVTFDSAFTNALNTADDWVIISSRNPSGTAYWVYNTKINPSNITSDHRGRWYLSDKTANPDIVDYTVPGSWQPTLYQDGRDKKGQRRFILVASAALYGILYAQRTWENGPTIREEGAADGVQFSSPFPILDYDSTINFYNPYGMGKVFIGARAAGGNDFRELYTNTTLGQSTLTPNVTMPSGMVQIYHGLIPYDGDEIGQDWRRDSGSSTAVGSTTTLVDSKKAWKTDQWKGGTLKMTGGRRSGQQFSITSNTATVITIGTTLGTAIKSDQPYEIINKKDTVLLNDENGSTPTSDHPAVLTLNVSGLAIASLAAEEASTDISARFWIGGGEQSASVDTGHRRAYIDVGNTGEYFLMLKNSTGDYIELDSARRSSSQKNSSGTVLERYVDPRVRWRYYDADGNQVASLNGMLLPPGVNALVNPGAEVNANNWTKTNSGTITSTIARDTTYYAKQTGGIASFKLNITASTGPAYAEMVADDRIPITVGELAQFAGFVFTENANIKPLLGIRFFTAGGATISTDLQGTTPTYTTGRWYAEGHAAVAPATAATWAPVIRANIASGSPTGAVFFDDINVGAPVVFVQTDHNIGDVTISYVEAYLA